MRRARKFSSDGLEANSSSKNEFSLFEDDQAVSKLHEKISSMTYRS